MSTHRHSRRDRGLAGALAITCAACAGLSAQAEPPLHGKPTDSAAASPPATCTAYISGTYNPSSLKTVFNVLAYGAVADSGATDNQPFFAAAIAAAAAMGGEVYVPRPPNGAWYGIGSPIVLSGDAGAMGVRLFGDSTAADVPGVQATIKAITTGSSQFVVSSGTGATMTTYARSGIGASIAMFGSTATITGLSGIIAGATGQITISAASHSGNVGTFASGFTFISPTSVRVTVPSGISEKASVSWSVVGNAPNGTAVDITGMSSLSVSKIVPGDTLVISNAATSSNNTPKTVLGITSATSVVAIHTGGLNAIFGNANFSSPDAGLAGGVTYKNSKPLIKCHARGAAIERLSLDGSSSCGALIDITNDTTNLTTNVTITHLSLNNAQFGLKIGDSGANAGASILGQNVENGYVEKVYTNNVTFAGAYFPSHSGQQYSWDFRGCSFGPALWGIYAVSGAPSTFNCNYTGITGACIAISKVSQPLLFDQDTAENCRRYLALSFFAGSNAQTKVRGTRFASPVGFASDGCFIVTQTGTGLTVEDVKVNAGVTVETHLVGVYGESPAPNSSLQTAVRICGSCVVGGFGDELVVPFPAGAGGGIPYIVDGMAQFLNVSRPGNNFAYPMGTFVTNHDFINPTNAGLVIPPTTITNLAQAEWLFAPGVIVSGANLAIPYQGYSQMLLRNDPGGAFSLDGMAPPPPVVPGGMPQESSFSFLFFPARAVTVNHLTAGAADGWRFSSHTGTNISVGTPAAGGFVKVEGRYDNTADPVALAGTATITISNGATRGTIVGTPQSFKAHQWLNIAGRWCRVLTSTRSSSSFALVAPFPGTGGSGLSATVSNGAWLVTGTR